MTEDQLQRLVQEFAEQAQLRAVHFRQARTAHGWETPVQGNGGRGFPDWFFWWPHPGGGHLWAELKGDTGGLSRAQRERIAEMRAAGLPVVVWTPDHWHDGTITRTLLALRRGPVAA